MPGHRQLRLLSITHSDSVVGQFEINHPSGAKAPFHFRAFAAPFDFALGRLEVVPFQNRFKLTHYRKWRTNATGSILIWGRKTKGKLL